MAKILLEIKGGRLANVLFFIIDIIIYYYNCHVEIILYILYI